MEILEQAFKSYLKNVEGCSVVQTNWTPSPIQMDGLSQGNLTLVEKIANETMNTCPLDIFKKSKDDQFIRQAEIDVLGIKIEANQKVVYLFDTAFHKNGLGYHDTVATVIKKLLRAAIVGHLFFEGFDIHVGFLSPKCSNRKLNEIMANIPVINNILRNNSIQATIEVYVGNQFELVIKDLIALKDHINDNDDIFMRAVQLLDLTNQNASPTNVTNQNSPVKQVAISPTNKGNVPNKEIIIPAIEDLINRGKIDATMLSSLCDKDYTSKTFQVSSFPFFKKANSIGRDEQNRYYPNIFCPVNNGVAYRVTNQWRADKNIPSFLNWYNSVK